MNLRIDGRPAALVEVVVYDEKFGELNDFQVVPYEIEIEKTDFVARLEPVYDECVQELKRDDAIVGGFQPTLHRRGELSKLRGATGARIRATARIHPNISRIRHRQPIRE